ncbi:MAG: hypothetical protein ACI4JB_11165 [Porcipelethomonas sp.]
MVNDIIEEIRKNLTGETMADADYLQQQAMKYRDHENAEEILSAISDMTFDLVPEDKKQYLKETMFIGDKRLDQVFNDANNLFKEGKLEESAELMKRIEERADAFRKNPQNQSMYSFRNRFDEYLFMELYKPKEQFARTPYDICTYLTAYGYILVEMRKPEEAVGVLEKAISFNPVNIGPRFELAETYKMLHQPAKLLYTIKETLPITSSPEEIARCYCNLGYYCIDIKDYDSAVAFYYASMLYFPNERVTGEIQHIAMLKGKQVDPPAKADIEKAFAKYNIKEGPNMVVVNMAYSLGEYCVEHNAHPQESLFYYSIAYNLTREEKIKKKLDKLVEEARALAKKQAEEKEKA